MPVGIGGEIGWWCPSLDSAGNGTTTLTDLVATTGNGTLTGMDAATDWVSDTGSGGVRALDFVAATQQYVQIAKPTMSGGKFSLALWGKATLDVASRVSAIWTDSFAGGTSGFSLFNAGSRIRGVKGSPVATVSDTSAVTLNVWYHWCYTFDGTMMRIYRNGSLTASTTSSGLTYPTSMGFSIGSAIPSTPLYINDAVYRWNGLLDDIRLFNTNIDAANTDSVAALASMRGYQPSTGKKRPRINGSLINSGLCRSNAS